MEWYIFLYVVDIWSLYCQYLIVILSSSSTIEIWFLIVLVNLYIKKLGDLIYNLEMSLWTLQVPPNKLLCDTEILNIMSQLTRNGDYILNVPWRGKSSKWIIKLTLCFRIKLFIVLQMYRAFLLFRSFNMFPIGTLILGVATLDNDSSSQFFFCFFKETLVGCIDWRETLQAVKINSS